MNSLALRIALYLVVGLWLLPGAPAAAQQDAEPQSIEALEEQAMREAVARVAPSVVRIETVGGLEKVGKLLVGTGPTTGLIVSEDGYILSSAFNFVQNPASILIALPDGKRLAAKRVATDHSRMLVLLKVDPEGKLPVPQFAPSDAMQVGQWAIAVGRTFEGGRTNISVGILSAVGRIFGKAIQTDAKISPSNYGGPLIDIHGRVQGVLVPMSPQRSGEIAGVEWYDSGIGFAIPLANFGKPLERMKLGDDLYAGVMGIGLRRGDQYVLPAEVATAQPNAPAFKAGLRVGDRVVEVEGRKVATQMQLKLQMGSRYAGDKVHVVVLRDDKRLEFDVELTDKLEPFVHAFLGVLPQRASADDEAGISVRYVYPGRPAAKSGIEVGDRITVIDGKPALSPQQAIDLLNTFVPKDRIAVELERGGKKLQVEADLASIPEDIPQELPAPHEQLEPDAGEVPKTGWVDLKLGEFKNESKLYVPSNYHPAIPYSVVLWLHGPGGNDQKQLEANWKPLCEAHDLILVVPAANDPAKWERTEGEFLRKLLDEVVDTYHVDPTRVVAHGFQSGGAMAYLLALGNRELIRGVAAVDAPLPGLGRVPPVDPVNRLAVFTTTSTKSRFAERIVKGIETLRKAKYPVSVIELGEEARPLNAQERAALIRWVDSLDRF